MRIFRTFPVGKFHEKLQQQTSVGGAFDTNGAFHSLGVVIPDKKIVGAENISQIVCTAPLRAGYSHFYLISNSLSGGEGDAYNNKEKAFVTRYANMKN